MPSLKIVYAGTPEFAQVAFSAILNAGYDVSLVLTQPDRPAGRGMKVRPSAVKQLAQEKGIEVLQPAGLKLDGKYADEAKAVQLVLEKLRPDVMVVAAYGLILPQWVLDLPKHGCLNIHASLLPRWRGAAPIHRAIEAGDKQTGVCIMQMDAGLDTGDVVAKQSLQIDEDETTESLHDKLSVLGGEMIVSILSDLKAQPQRQLSSHAQSTQGICYAHKIEKVEAEVDWTQSAEVIERRIRAFDPFPGVVTQFGDLKIKLWRSNALPSDQLSNNVVAGEVVLVKHDGIVVQTGAGFLHILEAQRPGGRRQPIHEFLQAVPIQVGDLFN